MSQSTEDRVKQLTDIHLNLLVDAKRYPKLNVYVEHELWRRMLGMSNKKYRNYRREWSRWLEQVHEVRVCNPPTEEDYFVTLGLPVMDGAA